MGIRQQVSISGTPTTGTSITITFPQATLATSKVVAVLAGNAYAPSPGAAWTTRAAATGWTGHYILEANGGQTTYAVTTSSGMFMWHAYEVENGAFVAAPAGVSTEPASVSATTTPSVTPTAGTRLLIAGISVLSDQAIRTVSSWSGGFTENHDAGMTAGADRITLGAASLEAQADGSTAYATTATLNAGVISHARTIAAFATSSGGGSTNATVTAVPATATAMAPAPAVTGTTPPGSSTPPVYSGGGPYAGAWTGDFIYNVPIGNPAAGNFIVGVVILRPTTASLPNAIPMDVGPDLPLIAETTGGTGTFGVDAGPTRILIYGREAVGGETTMHIPVVGGTGWTTATLAAQAYGAYASKQASDQWDVAVVFGEDNTHGTGWSATASSNPGLTVGDLLLMFTGTDVDTASWSAYSVTAAGATIGTVTSRLESPSTTGNDGRFTFRTASVTAGTATSAPVHTGTLASPGACGVTAFVRVRTTTASSGATVTAVTATATASARAPVLSAATSVTGGGPVAGTAQANPPVVRAGATVTSPAATSTATARAASVQAGVTVAASTATAIAAAPSPVATASGSATVIATTATAQASIPVPSVTASGSVTVVATTATATAAIPATAITARGSATATATPATAQASAPAPTAAAAAAGTVLAVAATASASAPTPLVTAAANVQALAATATAQAQAALATLSVTIAATPATATSAALAPTFTDADPEPRVDITVTIGPSRLAWDVGESRITSFVVGPSINQR